MGELAISDPERSVPLRTVAVVSLEPMQPDGEQPNDLTPVPPEETPAPDSTSVAPEETPVPSNETPTPETTGS